MTDPLSVASTAQSSTAPQYVRYQALEPNHRGIFPGVFALANGLAADDRLSVSDRLWWRAANDRMNAAYPNPSAEDPTVFDRLVNPGASSWFKSTANHLLNEIRGYEDLLARYGIGQRVLSSADPGRIIYEDSVQVIVVPAASTGEEA